MATTREAVVAGQFYPGSKSGLEKMLSNLTDTKKNRERVLGAMSPHAGYIYSGAVAGAVFSRIASKELFIIIGPNHTGTGEPFSIFTEGRWKTPLGAVEIDSEFATFLVNNSEFFKSDEVAHAYEHSIEVQIPFLQFLMKDFKIVPICLSSMDMDKLKKIASELARAIRETKREVVIIASSDMTHYEAHESAKKKDMQAISAILNMNEEKLFEKIQSMDITMCGVAPVIVALNTTKSLDAKKAELVDYKTSGDSSGDYSSVVGYGGVIIK